MLRRVTPLNGETVLALADAKAQCRVLHTEEDALIASLRDAAVDHVETESGVILSPSQFVWEVDCFPRRFPVRPVTALGAITYIDSLGATATYTGARLENQQIKPAFNGSWPASYGVISVTFTAGETDLALVKKLVAAVRMKTQELFERAHDNPDAVKGYAMAVEALIHSYRRVFV